MKDGNKIIDTFSIVQELKEKYNYLNINEADFNNIVKDALMSAKKEFSGSSINEYKSILIKKLTDLILEYEKNICYTKENYEDNFEINSYLQYIKDIRNADNLSTIKLYDLLILYKNGNKKAKDVLIIRNLGLVIEAAKQFQDKGLEMLDLIDEGNLGLIKAIERYDINRGCPFATYALIWINQSIRRAIALKTRNIKLPMLPYLQVNKLQSTKIKLAMELGREPLYSEIAKELNLSIEKIRELELLQHDTVSLNNEYLLLDDIENNEIDVVEVVDMICDKNNQTEETVFANLMKEEVSKIFDNCNLSEREKEILYYRFGLYGREERICKDIKGIFGISGERVRQIAENAILKIRRSKYTKKLAIFMDNPEQARLTLNKYQKTKKKQ